TITLGYIPSWTDGLSTAYLLDHFLSEAGYTVEHEELSEAGVLYTALAQSDVDIYPSAWPEVTHAEYMEQYGDQMEDLGTYYDNAELTFECRSTPTSPRSTSCPTTWTSCRAGSWASSPAPATPRSPRTACSPSTGWVTPDSPWPPPRPRRCSPSWAARSTPRSRSW